jgi:hypothetical protein
MRQALLQESQGLLRIGPLEERTDEGDRADLLGVGTMPWAII